MSSETPQPRQTFYDRFARDARTALERLYIDHPEVEALALIPAWKLTPNDPLQVDGLPTAFLAPEGELSPLYHPGPLLSLAQSTHRSLRDMVTHLGQFIIQMETMANNLARRIEQLNAQRDQLQHELQSAGAASEQPAVCDPVSASGS